jgi:hypothetical protein
MPNVFEYTDYRKFLADWYNYKKNANHAFSYNGFAQKAGFKNKGFFHTVIHDKRNLTKSSLVKVVQAVGLTKNEADYFENLVFFNQATDLKDRNYFYEKLSAVRSPQKSATKAKQVRGILPTQVRQTRPAFQRFRVVALPVSLATWVSGGRLQAECTVLWHATPRMCAVTSSP